MMIFKINYGSQFKNSYNSIKLRKAARQLWFEGLKQFTPDQIKRASFELAKKERFLPTLAEIIEYCLIQWRADNKILSPEQAYKRIYKCRLSIYTKRIQSPYIFLYCEPFRF